MRRHALGEDARAAPAVRPVRRLRRIVRAQQCVAIDVSFEIRDRHEPDPSVADVGYLTAPYARGTGTTTAALEAICAWGFETLRLERIEWRAQVGNEASRRVAEKVGFRLEGVNRALLRLRGERYDTWIASLLPHELTELPGELLEHELAR